MNLDLKTELIILDNGSVEAGTLDYLSSLRKKGIKVLRDPSEFNFSRLINMGAREASGDLLLLLNNDVVLDHSSSLTDLVADAIKPSVGAVGVKLLFPDGTVQHAGVSVPSLGSAGHMLRGVENDAGKFPALQGTWPVEAVTGAFLVVERLKFNLVGGFDEELAVGLNDIDFCLKLSALGLTNYVNCDFSGTHAESASRGSALRGQNLSRAILEIVTFRLRWIK
jgi:GT2 family glycosyltransferase